MKDNKDDKKNRLKRHAEEVGCFGLVDGAAANLYTHENCYARTASKSDGPFYCKVCYSDAVLRKCSEKIDHFAHLTPLSPVIPSSESSLHRECKESICKHISNIFPGGKWEVERPIPENKDKGIDAVRPDISGRIDGQPIAIEVQASSLTIPKIIQRTKTYSKRGIAMLWIVPLLEELSDKPFRPRLYERYFHSMYYGRVYYWWPEIGDKLSTVHYGIAKRHIDFSTWFDENGDQQEAGGYDKTYKVIKTPVFGSNVSIESDFYFHNRKEFTPDNERKSIPKCITWQDKLNTWWKTKQVDSSTGTGGTS